LIVKTPWGADVTPLATHKPDATPLATHKPDATPLATQSVSKKRGFRGKWL